MSSDFQGLLPFKMAHEIIATLISSIPAFLIICLFKKVQQPPLLHYINILLAIISIDILFYLTIRSNNISTFQIEYRGSSIFYISFLSLCLYNLGTIDNIKNYIKSKFN